jgi:hypothetical protein
MGEGVSKLRVVKFLTDDDGSPVIAEDQRWHVATIHTGCPAIACTLEYYGVWGSDAGVVFEEKYYERDDDLCANCVTRLKEQSNLYQRVRRATGKVVI